MEEDKFSLSDIDEKVLKSIKVAIKRGEFQKNLPSKEYTLKRDLVEPESLKIHFSGTNRKPLLSRADVKVNLVKLEPGSLERIENDKVEKTKSSGLFKEYYNCAPPYAAVENENSYPSTSRGAVPRNYREHSSSSEKSTSSRNKRSSSRTKCYKHKSGRQSKSPKYYRSSHRDYRKSRSPRYKYYKEYEYTRRKSPSPKSSSNDYKYKYSPPREYRSKRPERSPPYDKRNKSPLRPGEYRPRKHFSRSPKRSRSPPSYTRHAHYEPYTVSDFRPPPMLPRYIPDMFRPNGPILVPHIQYIPVPQPMIPPMRHPIRPPKIYNNRPIPLLNPQFKGEKSSKVEDKKHTDSTEK